MLALLTPADRAGHATPTAKILDQLKGVERPAGIDIGKPESPRDGSVAGAVLVFKTQIS
jgi:hypothetical protein